MKHAKVVLAAAVVAAAMNLSFADGPHAGMPKGWSVVGAIGEGYAIGFDPAEAKDGRASAFIEGRNAPQDKIAALTQTLDAGSWQGKLVRLTVMTKTLDESTKAEVWLRGIGDRHEQPGADKLKVRYEGISSTSGAAKDWKQSTVALIVAPQMNKLELGVGLRGEGKVWMRDAKLTELSKEEMEQQDRSQTFARQVPVAQARPGPVNLELAE